MTQKIDLAKYIDHTLLRADASPKDITKLCDEAIKHGFYSVCINPCYVGFASTKLQNSNVKICTVVGFPLGANTISTKVYEIKNAIDNGADEIDVVMNIDYLKRGAEYRHAVDDLDIIREAVGDKILKVIIETALLTKKEIETATGLCIIGRADFVKTSTGFANGGATIEDIKLIKSVALDKIKIKASGGIKTAEFVLELIEAGADRIGTSNSVEIIKEKGLF